MFRVLDRMWLLAGESCVVVGKAIDHTRHKSLMTSTNRSHSQIYISSLSHSPHINTRTWLYTQFCKKFKRRKSFRWYSSGRRNENINGTRSGFGLTKMLHQSNVKEKMLKRRPSYENCDSSDSVQWLLQYFSAKESYIFFFFCACILGW